jgi:effector-binding domain-containing protein
MDTTTSPPEIVDLSPATTAVIRGDVAASELPGFFDRSFSTLPAVLAEQGVAVLGPAFALYHAAPGERVQLEVGFPTDRPVTPVGEVRAASLPGGPTARLVHHGSFDGLGASWERLMAWAAEQGHTPTRVFWEVYVTEPSPEMDPSELVTVLHRPVAG